MLNFTNNNVHPPIEKFCLKWTRHSIMLQNALETLTDAWQKNQHDLSPSSSTGNAAASQISQLTAAAEQLLGNRSELTINRVVSPTQNNDFSYQQRRHAPSGDPSCQLADTTLYLGDGSRVRTHYLVLAAGSSFFRSLNQVIGSDIIIPDGGKEDLMAVLQFLYTGAANIQVNRLGDILDLARALSIDSLVATIEEIIDDVDKCSETSETSSNHTASAYTNHIQATTHNSFNKIYSPSIPSTINQTTSFSHPQQHQLLTTTQQPFSSTQSVLSSAVQSSPLSLSSNAPLNLSQQGIIPLHSSAATPIQHSTQQIRPTQHSTHMFPRPSTASSVICNAINLSQQNLTTNVTQPSNSADILRRLTKLEPCDLSVQQSVSLPTTQPPKIVISSNLYKSPEHISPPSNSSYQQQAINNMSATKRPHSSNSESSSVSAESLSIDQLRRPLSTETADEDVENGAPNSKQLRLSSNLLESVLLKHAPNTANSKNFVSPTLDTTRQNDELSEIENEVVSKPTGGKLATKTLDSREKVFGNQILPLLGALPTGNHNLSTLLSAAVKLKQVADIVLQKGEKEDRKLAFHEPRPCPTCKRMYRDAATLRTHTSIMHTKGPQPYRCSCGTDFDTKYGMYNHKKSGHPAISAPEICDNETSNASSENSNSKDSDINNANTTSVVTTIASGQQLSPAITGGHQTASAVSGSLQLLSSVATTI